MSHLDELMLARQRLRTKSVNDFHEHSRSRLSKIVSRKMMTAFIYAIAEFERTFGTELWGHGLDPNSKSEAQKLQEVRWEQVRTAILNNGHSQIRAVKSELALHEVAFDGYHAEPNQGC